MIIILNYIFVISVDNFSWVGGKVQSLKPLKSNYHSSVTWDRAGECYWIIKLKKILTLRISLCLCLTFCWRALALNLLFKFLIQMWRLISKYVTDPTDLTHNMPHIICLSICLSFSILYHCSVYLSFHLFICLPCYIFEMSEIFCLGCQKLSFRGT